MKKKKKKLPMKKRMRISSGNPLEAHSQMAVLNEKIKAMMETSQKQDERIQDIEIHVNLLTRLLTTLCIEKFGMRIGVLKRLIKRIEKEAIRDSQIMHLETLYKLPAPADKKNQPPAKNDPWEEIS